MSAPGLWSCIGPVNTDLARWQFATTSIYHFLFVPVTIGLAFLVALLQTAWYRSGNPEHRRLARFFGVLLLINVAVGVVTGLVQEFEFGMNWSAYSRFVGDVFGAPLAMEGLAAFFLESTFLGLWMFGWDRLPKRVHLACIWLVAIGSMLSAAFILAANSWMQHPVGYSINPTTHQPQLNNVCALFTNPTFTVGLRARDPRVARHRVPGDARGVGVAPAQGDRGRRRSSARRRSSLVVLIPALGARAVRRQRARGGRGQVPADEDRRRRGAVDHLPAVLVLGLPDRGRQARRDADQDHRDPVPAVVPGHRTRSTARSSASTSSSSSTRSSTARATTSRTCSSSTGRCG